MFWILVLHLALPGQTFDVLPVPMMFTVQSDCEDFAGRIAAKVPEARTDLECKRVEVRHNDKVEDSF